MHTQQSNTIQLSCNNVVFRDVMLHTLADKY